MYEVNFRDGYDYFDGRYSLSEVIELCVDLEVKADLWNENGFRAGWVKPSGDYTLI